MAPTQNIPELLKQLRSSLLDLNNQTEIKSIIDSDEVLIRFLKARDWDLQATEKMLRKDLQWRLDSRPQLMDCKICHTKPGTHSLRQIGFDEAGRPVIYASFYQAASQRNMTSDVVTHLVYTIENAIRSMGVGITQWVFVIDCAGMTSSSCHPRLGYECAHLMSNHYPERLGLAICIRPGPAFKVAWQAVKPFLPSNTVSKVCLIKSKSKIRSTFEQYFSPQLCDWLMTEITLNRTKPAYVKTRPFWLQSTDPKDQHDPRGSFDYVNNWFSLNHSTGHLPHPNILDQLLGCLVTTNRDTTHINLADEDEHTSDFDENELDEDDEGDDDDDDTTVDKIAKNLPKEFQIPSNAEKLL